MSIETELPVGSVMGNLINNGTLPAGQERMGMGEFRGIVAAELRWLMAERAGVHWSGSEAVSMDSGKARAAIGLVLDLQRQIAASAAMRGNSKQQLAKVLWGNLMALWTQSSSHAAFFAALRELVPAPQLVAAMWASFGEGIDWLLGFFLSNKEALACRREVKTIGIYYPRFYNGGLERFLSQIMPIYLSAGYKVVFFTDVIAEKLEYPLPPEVTRVVLKNKFGPDIAARLAEFAEAAKEHSIDVFCSHAVVGIGAFYQMLLFKILGIPVIFELHGVFAFYVTDNMSLMTRNPSIYQLADRLIVLSRVNKKFWDSLGCSSTYIPNPIPTDMLGGWAGRDPSRSTNTILWVGRISTDKQIMDIVPIMAEAVRHVPDAKLNLLGGVDVPAVHDRLKELIKENGLEKNINILGYQLDMHKYYAEADVMLMTSPAEGFPYAVSESKLHGLPIVMYELPYLELIRAGGGYISVPQRDARGAGLALARVLRDGGLRARLSREARESLDVFLNYDFAGAWGKVFKEIAEGAEPESVDFEQQQIEKILLTKIWQKDARILQLMANKN